MGKNLLEILLTVISSFVLPLLSSILFELWEEIRTEKRGGATPLFSMSQWEILVVLYHKV